MADKYGTERINGPDRDTGNEEVLTKWKDKGTYDSKVITVDEIESSVLPTGAATEAKQDDLLTELQLKADLTERQPITIYDSSGNEIEAHTDADGEKYLGVAAIQAVHDDPNNSSTDNLDAGNSYTFTGTATSTLGVAGLQWSLKTDQNATVYIDQSPDGTNWDISDHFDYYYIKGGAGSTVQAVNSYWRIRVILTGTTATTYFRLQGVLCPIAPPLPRSLDDNRRLKTSGGIIDVETAIDAKVTPFGIQKSVNPIRIIGTSFSGTTKDPNFWTETVTGTGSVTQAGEITLATGTTANSTAKYTSVRRARHVAGNVNEFKFTGRLITAPQADNLRRCGVYDANEGFFFQINGITFGVGARKAGVDTIVNSGSFNGNLGDTVSIETTFGNFSIWYWERTAQFFLNGKLLHSIQAVTTSLVDTLTLPITIENNNSNGNVTNNSLEILVASVVRFGDLITNPQSKYIGTNTTTVCKYGAGTLQRIVNVDNAGTLTIYDNTAASGTIIATIDTSKALGTLEFEAPFSNGLTVVTATGAKVVIVYE